jgi:hypothetical protein
MAEFAIGKNVDDVILITNNDIVREPDGLPEFKIHYSALGASGIHKAIMGYCAKTLAWGRNRKNENDMN